MCRTKSRRRCCACCAGRCRPWSSAIRPTRRPTSARSSMARPVRCCASTSPRCAAAARRLRKPVRCPRPAILWRRSLSVGSIAELPGERFGPVLHVARFAIADLEKVVEDINATGYGLTLGIHTRIDARAGFIRSRAAVGNVYVNRNMIGAVVGSQPFGGEGLSGTGPKAGRAALSASLCDRARIYRQHRRGRRGHRIDARRRGICPGWPESQTFIYAD